MKLPRLALQPIGRSIWWHLERHTFLCWHLVWVQLRNQRRFLTRWWFGSGCMSLRGKRCYLFGLWCMVCMVGIRFYRCWRFLFLRYIQCWYQWPWHIWFCSHLEHYHCSKWSKYRLVSRYQVGLSMSSSIWSCPLRLMNYLGMGCTQFYQGWRFDICCSLELHQHWWLVLVGWYR